MSRPAILLFAVLTAGSILAGTASPAIAVPAAVQAPIVR